MKRKVIALLVVGLLAFSAFAESSVFYPVRLDVLKIFSHSEGYRVMYRQGAVGVAEFLVPIAWFQPGGKAEIILGHGSAYPYAMVYFKDGKFDHLKLFLVNNPLDATWGQLSPAAGHGIFDSVTEIVLKL
jgi:hypothetical protein